MLKQIQDIKSEMKAWKLRVEVMNGRESSFYHGQKKAGKAKVLDLISIFIFVYLSFFVGIYMLRKL